MNETTKNTRRAITSRGSWNVALATSVTLLGVAISACFLQRSVGAQRAEAARHTVVSIAGARFLLNGAPTYPGSRAEGLLLNSRMVQAIFDDENADTAGLSAYPDTGVWDPERNVEEFIAALPTYAASGLRAVTVNLQGGSPGWSSNDNQPGITTAFNPDGSLKLPWLDRLDRVIRAADRNGIVVIVSCFYFGQDQRIDDESAVIRGVDGVTDWLVASRYRNVLVEINNEADVWYNHPILQPERVIELIERVRDRSARALKVSASLAGGSVPSEALIRASDFVLLHGNDQSADRLRVMVERIRASAAYQADPKPIMFNEDSTTLANLEAAVASGASWGYYDQGLNNYQDGFQSPPVNWGLNTVAKRTIFDRFRTLTGAPVARREDMRVDSFTVIDADTDAPLTGLDIAAGEPIVIHLGALPTRRLSLRANIASTGAGSVRFDVDSWASYALENIAPYALAGDIDGDYGPWLSAAGTHVITATPFTGTDGSGTPGRALSVIVTLEE